MKTKAKLGFEFYKLWLANAISTLGDGALLAAGPLLVASLTKDPTLIAGAVFVQLAPWLLFSFVSGVYVDRFEKRHVLTVANVLRAVAIGGLAIAIGSDAATIPIIYFCLFLLGIGDTIADGGTVTLLTQIISKGNLALANSRLQVANIIGRQLAGPPLGAYLFVIAAALPFGFDAVSFIVATLLVLSIKINNLEERGPEESNRKSVISEVKEGFYHLREIPLLNMLTYLNGLLNVTSMAIFATLILYAQEQLKLGSLGYGLLLSAAAVGGMIGSLIAPTLTSRFSDTTLLRAVMCVEALLNLSFVFIHSPWLAGIAYALFSVIGIIWLITITSMRQRIVAPNLLGRVNGIYNFYRMGGLAIGSLFGGLLVTQFGVTAPFWAGAVIVGLLAVYSWKRLNYQN
jgi:MFS family permease